MFLRESRTELMLPEYRDFDGIAAVTNPEIATRFKRTGSLGRYVFVVNLRFRVIGRKSFHNIAPLT